jgi:hypothetical protein
MGSTLGEFRLAGKSCATFMVSLFRLSLHAGLLIAVAGMTGEENDREREEAADGITDLDAQHVDITPYLSMPQADAAGRLGVPISSLSKRWKESVKGRKWPHRALQRLDSRIVQFMSEIAQDDVDKGTLSDNAEKQLTKWLQERAVLLKPTTIRMTLKK